MGQIVKPYTFEADTKIRSAEMNACLDELFNEFNGGIGNDNIDSGEPIAGTKITLGTNTTFLAEHSAAGGHTAFATNNVEHCRLKKNVATPNTKVDIDARLISVYNSDTIATRLRKLIQSVDLTADIGVSGSNGLDTGAAADSTWYFVWVGCKSDGTLAISLLSLASTIAGITKPSGYATGYWSVGGKVYRGDTSKFEYPIPIAGSGWAGSDLLGFQPRFALMTTGRYQGNGTSQPITGVGFPPDVVMIFQEASASAPCVKTDQMTGAYSRSTYTKWAVDMITALDDDGFTVGNGAEVNTGTTWYNWTAFRKHALVA